LSGSGRHIGRFDIIFYVLEIGQIVTEIPRARRYRTDIVVPDYFLQLRRNTLSVWTREGTEFVKQTNQLSQPLQSVGFNRAAGSSHSLNLFSSFGFACLGKATLLSIEHTYGAHSTVFKFLY
jgi:hypothetical protein